MRNSFDGYQRTPNKLNYEPTLVDASPDMETVAIERSTRTERRYTVRSKWALEMTLEAHQEDGLCHLL